MTLFITILQLLCGLIVIGIVLFQSGKSAGLSGAIGGVADSFLAKNKAKSTDARLARATMWVGVLAYGCPHCSAIPRTHWPCLPWNV